MKITIIGIISKSLNIILVIILGLILNSTNNCMIDGNNPYTINNEKNIKKIMSKTGYVNSFFSCVNICSFFLHIFKLCSIAVEILFLNRKNLKYSINVLSKSISIITSSNALPATKFCSISFIFSV